MNRNGITAAGNWIVDRVKQVDCLPRRGMLANIKSMCFSPGGAPANVLNDLARLLPPSGRSTSPRDTSRVPLERATPSARACCMASTRAQTPWRPRVWAIVARPPASRAPTPRKASCRSRRRLHSHRGSGSVNRRSQFEKSEVRSQNERIRMQIEETLKLAMLFGAQQPPLSV